MKTAKKIDFILVLISILCNSGSNLRLNDFFITLELGIQMNHIKKIGAMTKVITRYEYPKVFIMILLS